MMWNIDDAGWSAAMGFGLHAIFLLLVLGLVIRTILVVLRELGNVPAPAVSRPRRMPLSVLKERYARGELSRDRFETLRRALQ